MLEQQLRERGVAGVDDAFGGSSGALSAAAHVPAPEAVSEDELVVIRHRLQGELNSIDGR
jgi:hypothetical protein